MGDNPMDRELAAVLTFTTAEFKFECNTSRDGWPYQNCINLISAYCQTGSPVFTSIKDCIMKVVSVWIRLHCTWKSYITDCAKFLGGNPNSSYCGNSTNYLLTNVYYILPDGTYEVVPVEVINAAQHIWNLEDKK